MRLPRRTVWAIIVALVCVDLTLRYPQTPHGVGVDSFSFLTLTHAVVSQGRLAWIVHPLSPFGLYPLSYPSGSFALAAAFSDTSGTALEPATLVLSLATGVFGIFSAFTMAREFWRNDIFAINVAIVFSLMPKFLTNTLWEVPTRGLFMALTPLFLWAILRAVKVATAKTMGFAGLMLLLLGLFHRLAVLMVVVFIAFLVTLIFATAAQVAKRRFPNILMTPSFRSRSRLVGLLVYSVVLAGLLFGSGVLESYQRGAYFSNDGMPGALGNLALSLARSVGVLSPLALLGIPVVLFARNKAQSEYLFLSLPLAIIPTLFLRSYTGFYVVAFFALFIAMGCSFLLIRLRGRLVPLAIVAVLVAATAGGSLAVRLELPSITHMTDSEYSAGLYAQRGVTGAMACNDGLLASRIASVSGMGYLPIGGATTAAYGPEAMAFGFVRQFNAVPLRFTDLNIDSDALYSPADVTVGADWSVLMSSHLGPRADQIAHQYGITTVCENVAAAGIYHTGWGVDYESPLLQDMYSSRYAVFQGDGIRIWQAF